MVAVFYGNKPLFVIGIGISGEHYMAKAVDEKGFIKGLVKGDRDKWLELIREVKRDVYRVYYSKGPAFCEDLVQNVLINIVNLLKHNKDFSPIFNFSTYISSIIVREASHMRELTIQFEDGRGLTIEPEKDLPAEIYDCIDRILKSGGKVSEFLRRLLEGEEIELDSYNRVIKFRTIKSLKECLKSKGVKVNE